MTDADDVAAPDLQRESDFCAGVSKGAAFVVEMMLAVAAETSLRNEAKVLRNFAKIMAVETAKPTFYADTTARWLETSK
jgi:hypothetical protein